MRAFSHAGPLVVTQDVSEEFNSARALKPGDPARGVPPVKAGERGVAVPGLAREERAWLQPYEKGAGEKVGKEKEGKEAWERYVVLPTAVEDERPGMRRDRIPWWKSFCCLWEGRRLLLKVGW